MPFSSLGFANFASLELYASKSEDAKGELWIKQLPSKVKLYNLHIYV